jgi:hypothetical protein
MRSAGAIRRFCFFDAHVNRDDFKKLARIRLGGYAVECALKACYAKRTRRFDFPPDQQEYKKAYSHELTMLATIAGVRGELQVKGTKLASYWTTVQDWSHVSRYQIVTRKQAEDLIKAISDRKDGVLTCIQKHW